MGISSRRNGTNGRRSMDHATEEVATLDCDQDDLSREEVAYNGIPVSAPGVFGSDGKEHRLGFLHLNPGGEVSLDQH